MGKVLELSVTEAHALTSRAVYEYMCGTSTVHEEKEKEKEGINERNKLLFVVSQSHT